MKYPFYCILSSILLLPSSIAVAQIDITNLSGTISTQHSDSPAGEDIFKLIDNKLGTKFLTFNSSAWVQFRVSSPWVVEKYAITAANDAPERDPAKWTFEGSDNGSSWKILDSRDNQEFARFQRKEFSFTNKKAYRFFRLQMHNRSGDILQLGEWELYGPAGSDAAAGQHQGPEQLSFERNGYKLLLINEDSAFDQKVKKRLIETFFTVYPLLIAEYNSEGMKEVTFFIDNSYNGVAEAANGMIRFNPEWFRKHPGDIDVVTHESMHIIQSYPPNAGPGWLTEGIADYVRHRFGVDNAGGGWTLPDYKADQHYTNSYRITARFLAWLERNVKAGIVKELDAAMRSRSYDLELWRQLTGKSVEELWRNYSQNPNI